MKINDFSFKKTIDEILLTKKPSIGFEKLRISGKLKQILPEVDRLYGNEHSKKWHTEGDVWTHTMIAVDNARKITNDLPTLWSVLLHDIGKPDTAEERNGNITNRGHDKIGADMALSIANRMKFQDEEKEIIYNSVKDHMKAHQAKKMSKKTLKKFVNQKHIDPLLVVAKADSTASKAMKGFEREDSSIFIKDFIEMQKKNKKPKPFITGKDLIKLGMEPSPKFGKILKDIFQKQLDGQFSNKEEALKYIREKK